VQVSFIPSGELKKNELRPPDDSYTMYCTITAYLNGSYIVIFPPVGTMSDTISIQFDSKIVCSFLFYFIFLSHSVETRPGLCVAGRHDLSFGL
jgi:hypothetical protein